VRAPSSILSIAALFGGFLQAPFLHIHASETDHPATPLAHLHMRAAEMASSPALCAHTADDDAIDVEWRIAPPSAAAFSPDIAVSGTVAVAAPPTISIALVIPQPRGHDPPDLTSRQPRAPPA
jgi:hypothetical protein